MKAIRVGVAGLGVMGKNHARILSGLEGVTLAAVCDVAPESLTWARRMLGAPAYESYARMIEREQLDAVTIAVPTGGHVELALAALDRGLHVLVEKPIASNLADAEQLIAAAAARGRVLAVGHVERFNPAIQELKRRLAGQEMGRVFRVHARRLGPFPPRIRDVGVVIDLATHDLDVMCYLLGAEPLRLYAETQRRVHTEHEDMVSALLKFDNGTIASLDVNWLTPTKIRDLSVLAEGGLLHVDYITQGLTFYENRFTLGDWVGSPVLTGVGEGNVVRYRVERAEPLRLELASFVHAIATGTPPEVPGKDGVRALRLALELVASGQRGDVIAFKPLPEELARAEKS